MDDEERLERLLEVIAELAESNRETPILVEGRRDIESLRRLGCMGEIHALHAGKTLHDRAEFLAGSATEVILLTDWDRKGEELYEAMRVRLAANGVRAEGSFRDKIRLWMRPPVKDIESLAGYVARAMARLHGRELGESGLVERDD
jgi:5S rRNA maturation endonuclease (ribonuclease M5)